MSLWSKLIYLGRQALGDDTDPNLPPFEQDYQRAFHNGQFCSNWGTSKYYIDEHNDMYVGKGELQGTIYQTIGGRFCRHLHTINFMEPVTAPVDSSRLFSEPEQVYTSEKDFLLAINGLDKVDTHQVEDMHEMFANDCFLARLDLNSWDTGHVQDISFMFYHLSALKDINIADWDTRQVTNMRGTFNGTELLSSLNLHHWETSNVKDISWMFTNNSSLGDLDLSHFDLSNVQDASAMFLGMNDGTLIKLSPQAKKRMKGNKTGISDNDQGKIN